MAKRRIPISVDVPTLNWLDREISKGCWASYAHACRMGLKLLKKLHRCPTKMKQANSVKTEVLEENGK